MNHTNTYNQFTTISAKQWDFVTQENLTTKEAVDFLLNGMCFRTFRDILQLICGRDDQEAKIINELCNNTSKLLHKDSIRRKVRNWMNGKNLPTERSDIFQICFALELDLNQTDRMLALLTDQGIHYRNPQEMIFAYCLQYRLGYKYACELAKQFQYDKKSKSSHNEPITQFIRQEVCSINAEEDLISFILRNQNKLGELNNTAYFYFCKMLRLLTGESISGEECYSMEYVADCYLRLNVPLEKSTSKYGDIQKIIKKYWPGTRSIKAMKSRNEDVNRKTLLLMYLVTGGVWEQEYDELDETYIQPKEFLETHCHRLNDMLTECGMRSIDPRNAFDYLVLYCLRPEDELFMSDRMAQLAAEIFKS